MKINKGSFIAGLAIGIAVTAPTIPLVKDKIEALRLSRRNEFISRVAEWKRENAEVCEHSEDYTARYSHVIPIHFGEGIMPPHCNEKSHYKLGDVSEKQGLLGQDLWVYYVEKTNRSSLKK